MRRGVVALLSLWVSTAGAETYYVAVGGDDSRNCNAAKQDQNARRTLAAGLQCLAAGDTLSIGAGTWVGTLSSVDLANDITLVGVSDGGTLLRGARDAGAVILVPPGQPLRGLVLRNLRVRGDNNVNGLLWHGDRLQLDNVEVSNVTGDCVFVGRVAGSDAGSHLFSGLHAFDCGRGVRLAGDDSVIENGDFHGTRGNPVEIEDGLRAVSRVSVRRSRFHDADGGLSFGPGRDNRVENGVFYRVRHGVQFADGTADAGVRHNTFFQLQAEAVTLPANALGVRLEGNVMSDVAVAPVRSLGAAGTVVLCQAELANGGSNFIAPDAGNFRLRPGSTLVDACDAGPSVDHLGAARPQRCAFDLGAFELGGRCDGGFLSEDGGELLPDGGERGLVLELQYGLGCGCDGGQSTAAPALVWAGFILATAIRTRRRGARRAAQTER